MNMMIAKTAAEEALGINLPSRRDEDWKWTDLKRLIDKPYAPVSAKPSSKDIERLIASSPLHAAHVQRIVIVNGVMDAKHSKLQGLVVNDVAPAITHEDPLLALNAKLKAKTVSLEFTSNVDQPIEILHIATGQGETIASRLHIAVAEGASSTIVETFVGEGEYLNNPVTTVALAKGARLDRVKIENDTANAQHLSHVIATLAEGAYLNDFTLTSGAVLNRQNGTIEYHGPHANARVSGSYLLNGKQHADTTLVIDHKVPNCVSRELFKCVMGDNVIVRPDAQKTDGKQSSHALLLSETAEFDAKPELEIYADDVVCGHGTTCGDLNHDYLFYLMSRGIPKAQARAMLVEAFVAEAIETVENEAVREVLLALVHERMA
jgi:Fe-S cluster assembly protein SufD